MKEPKFVWHLPSRGCARQTCFWFSRPGPSANLQPGVLSMPPALWEPWLPWAPGLAPGPRLSKGLARPVVSIWTRRTLGGVPGDCRLAPFGERPRRRDSASAPGSDVGCDCRPSIVAGGFMEPGRFYGALPVRSPILESPVRRPGEQGLGAYCQRARGGSRILRRYLRGRAPAGPCARRGEGSAG
jgi:hypothetical protein